MRIRMAMLAAVLAAGPALAETDGLVVHEWGTFTSLQDESGRTIGGINGDDEPVPQFVHRISWEYDPNSLSKAVTRSLPSVTMRLETPVLYFHPAKNTTLPLKVDVQAHFKQGWLTEFYPDAEAATEQGTTAPLKEFKYSAITDKSFGKLNWRNLTVGTNTLGPATKARVWTAPREVDAAGVTSAKGESEKYVFYRGVAKLDAPLKAIRVNDQIELRTQSDPRFAGQVIDRVWIADFRPDGTCAYHTLPAFELSKDPQKVLATTSAVFAAADYVKIETLRTEMHSALVTAGLYDDEARAMLNTWEVSYFKSAGLRIFFVVPQAWTDHYLPLTITAQNERVTDTKRIMVGRIELVTPQHRQAIKTVLAPAPVDAEGKPNYEPRNKAYASLGRFREALLIDARRVAAPATATPAPKPQ